MGLFIAQTEDSLEQVSSYHMAVAGAEFNVAVGLSRLEHSVTYLTRLGNDPFGKRIAHVMRENGIGSEFITYSDERTTGFMLKSKVSQGDPEIAYFRKGSAASFISRKDVESLDFSGYTYLHLTGILPALSESARDTAFFLLEKARENGMTISFDPNLRPQLWPDQQTMVATINELASRADYVLPGEGEGEILCGSRDPRQICDFYRNLGTANVIVKLGGQGAYYENAEQSGYVKGFRVNKIVDTVGAGDGFAAGVISALMEGKSLSDAVKRGNAIGAIQVMSVGDNDGLPTRAQLAEFMGMDEL